jgi:hypothetical protein
VDRRADPQPRLGGPPAGREPGRRPCSPGGLRERALLAAAVLPGTGFDRLFRLQHERSPEGYAVESGGQVVGHLSHYDPELLTAMHTAEALARLPECLTRLLDASGAVALETAGRLLLEGELQA